MSQWQCIRANQVQTRFLRSAVGLRTHRDVQAAHGRDAEFVHFCFHPIVNHELTDSTDSDRILMLIKF